MALIKESLAGAIELLDASYKADGGSYFPFELQAMDESGCELPAGRLTLLEYEDCYADWLGVLLPFLEKRSKIKKPVIMFSNAVSSAELTSRFLLREARLDRSDLQRGYLSPKAWEELTTAATAVNTWPVDFLPEATDVWHSDYKEGLPKDSVLVLHTARPEASQQLLAALQVREATVILVRPKSDCASRLDASLLLHLKQLLSAPSSASLTHYDQIGLQATTCALRYHLGRQRFS